MRGARLLWVCFLRTVPGQPNHYQKDSVLTVTLVSLKQIRLLGGGIWARNRFGSRNIHSRIESGHEKGCVWGARYFLSELGVLLLGNTEPWRGELANGLFLPTIEELITLGAWELLIVPARRAFPRTTNAGRHGEVACAEVSGRASSVPCLASLSGARRTSSRDPAANSKG